MAHVRDRPSLREGVEITTPSGNRYRWSDDEDSPANVPSGERYANTMPGGFSEHDAVLPRKANIDYADLERLSTITRYDASGGIVWQGRLERAPKVSGDQMAISPSAVGWQAHLDDDKSAHCLYQDIALGSWNPPSTSRSLALVAGNAPQAFEIKPDQTNATSSLWLGIRGAWGGGVAQPIIEPWYDAGPGNEVGHIGFSWTDNGNPAGGDAWQFHVYSADRDDGSGASSTLTGDLFPAGAGSQNITVPGQRYVFLQWYYDGGAGGADNQEYAIYLTAVRVEGDHGLTRYGGEGNGFLASDIVAHAVQTWAPLLNVRPDTVLASGLIIEHLAFREPTTAAEMVRQATRFGLEDWAVWDDKTFWWHQRGAFGKRWRARVREASLEETGTQVERLWESVIVQYQDVDGSTRTVGPVGSGADTESDDLKDDDPDNPANRLGITRRALLVMEVSTAAGATAVGRRFLEESRLLDSSGRARLIGHVQDSHGVWHPYSHVRAGDMISFTDSSDTSYRRIVRTDKSRDDRSCSLDLDAPPEGLAALLERLGVVLVPLGV